jgi:hypothetical protein
VRTVRLVLVDSPFFPSSSLVVLVAFYGLSAAPGQTVRVALADCPLHLAVLSAWPVRTVRPSWPDSPLVRGSFAPWFDSSLLSFMFPRVLQGTVPKT